MINDEIGNKIVAGKVAIKGHLTKLQGRSAVFDDETIDGIDAIVVATGYKQNYSYLDSSLAPGTSICLCDGIILR